MRPFTINRWSDEKRQRQMSVSYCDRTTSDIIKKHRNERELHIHSYSIKFWPPRDFTSLVYTLTVIILL